MTAPTQPRRVKRITDREVAALRWKGSSPGRSEKHSVGDGLLLVVSPGGTRSWIARVTDASGRRRDIGLGPYPEVGLSDARRRAGELRNGIREGVDPLEAKRAAKRRIPSFDDVTRAYHAKRVAKHRSVALSDKWLRLMEVNAFPALGSTLITEVDAKAVRAALEPIWASKPETARRVLQRTAAVVAYAVSLDYRDRELPVAAIREGLPDVRVTVAHHPAVDHVDAPAVVAKLRASPETFSRLALEFTMLTAARSGEVRSMLWSEVDAPNALWRIPADKMKAAREHRVPLSARALAILERMRPAADKSGLVFPSTTGRPLSDVALSKAQKLVAPSTTVHGWRSTFRTWVGEGDGTTRPDVAEAALAHGKSGPLRGSYDRATFLDDAAGLWRRGRRTWLATRPGGAN